MFDSAGSFLRGWGSDGAGDGQFTRPRGIAVDRANATVYVADTNNNRVETFKLDGTFLTKFGGPGSGDGQFNLPYGITLDASGNVLVTDYLHGRIEKFHNGGFVSSFAVAQGNGSGLFNGVGGGAIGPDGNLYVVDTYNHRVQVFRSDGTWLRQWGTQGSGNGQFSYPYGIAVAADGTVYVANSADYRIDAFSPGGTFLRSIGNGSGDGQVSYPQAVAVDWTNGHVYVADTGNNRVKEFLPDGTYWTQWGSPGTAEGEFNSPEGIAVDAAHNVYVADTDNGRVQMFQSGGAFVRKWTVPYATGLATLSDGGVLATSGSSMRLLKPDGSVSVARFVGGGSFIGLRGIAADLQGYVYTTEANGNRVKRFGPLPTAPGKPAANPASSQGAFTVSWSAATAAGGGSLTYTLQHRDADDPAYTQVAAGLTGLTYTFTVAAPEPEGTWTYRVCGWNDVAGGPWTASETVKVDRTAPAAPGIVLDRAPDWSGSIAWFRDKVTASFSPGADPTLPDGSAGTGVDPASLSAAETFTTSGEHTVAATETDRAGNVSIAAKRTLGVDAAAPTITLAAPARVPQGASVSATWTAADTGGAGLSGPAVGTVPLDTSTLGAKTASVTVSDHVGHTTIATAAYTVTATTHPVSPNVLRMMAAKRMQPTPTGKLTFKLSCLGSRPGGCRTTVSLTSANKVPSRYLGRGKPRAVTFATGRFTIPSGATTTVTLRLSKANLALLQRMKTARAVLQAKANSTVVSRTVSLVAPRPSGHR